MTTPPDWFAPDGMSGVRRAQCKREWANRHRAMGLAPDRAETPQAAQGRSPAGPVTAEGGQALNTLWDKLEDYFEAEDQALLAAFNLTRETKGNV